MRTRLKLNSDTASTSSKPQTRWRKIFKGAMWFLATVALIVSAVGYWALNTYVIDHVEISDVAAYEIQQGTRVTARSNADSNADSNAGDTDPTGSDATGSDAIATDTTYKSDATSITISTVVTGSGNDQVTYYVADVIVDDATQIRGGFADNKFGENIIADTSEIAEDYGAVFAINGDYYGFRDSGIVIRNGVLFRDEGSRAGLAMYADGTMAIYDETETNGEDLIAQGVWNTLSFGPPLVDGGEIVEGIEDIEIDTNIGNHSIQGNQPRTGIGIISENHYVFVAVDGRAKGYSRGVTLTEFAQIFDDLGATTAYNLDGGGSTTMYFNGTIVNDPLGKGNERGTSDILYIAE